MPKASLSVASPLYLMMPEVERKKSKLSIKETSASKSRAKICSEGARDVCEGHGEESDEKVIGESLKQV